MSPKALNRLVLMDSALFPRIAGVAFAVIGWLSFLNSDRWMFIRWSFVVVGLGIALIVSDLTIIADRPSKTLYLQYRYLGLFNRTKQIPFDAIEDIRTERSSWGSRDFYGVSNRITAFLKDGRKVPFRRYYGGGNKKNQVKKLRTFIGLTRADREAMAAEAPISA